MLLIIEALLLILAALGQDHRAAVEGQIFSLDMALDSVDDQYDGCRDNMTKLVETGLLKKELNNSSDFNAAWKKGQDSAKTPKNGLTRNHSIAIYVYSDALVFKCFNNDTRHGKNQYKQKTYKWYSLYFLLTDAIQILNKQTNKQNNTTYRGTNVEFHKNVLNKEIRFGSFTSSSRNQTIAQGFGNKSCFEINSRKGADVTEYSKLRHEKEVLIPPYETFKVTAVKTIGEQKDLWCETVFVLNSIAGPPRRDLNCALFKTPSKTKKKYFVLWI